MRGSIYRYDILTPGSKYRGGQNIVSHRHHTPLCARLGEHTLVTWGATSPEGGSFSHALYLQQYLTDPFYICTSYQAISEGVSHVKSSFDLGSNMNQ